MSNVAVIGGGAAGMMAACTAAGNGHQVTLYEQNEKLGKKIYITGKGRCNLTMPVIRKICLQRSGKMKNFYTVQSIPLIIMQQWIILNVWD